MHYYIKWVYSCESNEWYIVVLMYYDIRVYIYQKEGRRNFKNWFRITDLRSLSLRIRFGFIERCMSKFALIIIYNSVLYRGTVYQNLCIENNWLQHAVTNVALLHHNRAYWKTDTADCSDVANFHPPSHTRHNRHYYSNIRRMARCRHRTNSIQIRTLLTCWQNIWLDSHPKFDLRVSNIYIYNCLLNRNLDIRNRMID